VLPSLTLPSLKRPSRQSRPTAPLTLALMAFSLAPAMPASARQDTEAGRGHDQDARSAQESIAPTSPPAVGEPVSALDKHMWIVFQAKDGVLWFGSDGQGVYRYDGKEGKGGKRGAIARFTTEHGLGGNHIRSIREDRAGNIFVQSDPGGVSRFDGRAFSTLHADPDPSKNLWRLDPEDLWFPGGQESGAVYRWDGTSLHKLTFPATAAGDKHYAEMPRSKYPNAKYTPYDVYTIFKDGEGHLWFGTASLGACRYDGSSFVWLGHGENGAFGVRSIVENKDRTFWLSNCVSRFAEVPPAATEPDAALPRYRKEPSIASEADDFSTFMSAVRDKNGDLWLATLGAGVWRYDGARMTHYPVTHAGAPIRVYAIYTGNDDTLWLGTQEHGVYRFNGTAFEDFTP
jgi:ligand-binding sensor domain-containing protein